jgi:hypothetical protein
MNIREKIALYEKMLSDPDLTEAHRETIAKLLAEEKKQNALPLKTRRETRG